MAIGVLGLALSSGLSMAAFGLYVSPLEDHNWTDPAEMRQIYIEKFKLAGRSMIDSTASHQVIPVIVSIR